MVTGSVVPWGERYEQKRQAERRSSEQERTTDKTLLCYLAEHRGKGISTHDNDCLNVLGKKNIVRVDLVVLAPFNTYEFLYRRRWEQPRTYTCNLISLWLFFRVEKGRVSDLRT